MRERVREIIEDFVTRDEYTLLPEVKLVVDRIFKILSATNVDSKELLAALRTQE